ncbi:uncharacterized protein [Procambarus clarkii]|uniref:uncharacterized protein n=1 Tax=Procambarus clarkii TaxID=6728 RepID=UPI00374231E3
MSTAGKVKVTSTVMKGHLSRQINKCEDLYTQTPVNHVELEGHHKVTERKFEQVGSQIQKYQGVLTDTAVDEATIEAVVQEHSGYEDAIQIKIQQFSNKIMHCKATTNITATASKNPTQPNVKLPSISLPTFSGTVDENWDNFWNKFVDSVDTNANIAKTTKFTYIQAILKGEALKVVCNLTLSDDGYDKEYSSLKKIMLNQNEVSDF